MCNNCFSMNRRTFIKASVSASAAALLGGLAELRRIFCDFLCRVSLPHRLSHHVGSRRSIRVILSPIGTMRLRILNIFTKVMQTETRIYLRRANLQDQRAPFSGRMIFINITLKEGAV